MLCQRSLVQILAVPLARKPLFPGTMVPLHVTDKKLLDELVELHNQGRWAALMT